MQRNDAPLPSNNERSIPAVLLDCRVDGEQLRQLPDQFFGRGLWLQADRDVPHLSFSEFLHLGRDHYYINPLVLA